jgi:hypothetical protein
VLTWHTLEVCIEGKKVKKMLLANLDFTKPNSVHTSYTYSIYIFIFWVWGFKVKSEKFKIEKQ